MHRCKQLSSTEFSKARTNPEQHTDELARLSQIPERKQSSLCTPPAHIATAGSKPSIIWIIQKTKFNSLRLNQICASFSFW